MCFFVKAQTKASKLAKKYGVSDTDIQDAIRAAEEQLSAFDHPILATVHQDSLRPMHWGLIPRWVRDRDTALEIRNKTLNARIETIFEKPSYRQNIREHRCIIPVDAFLEWQHVGKSKILYRIDPLHDSVFSIAGIWDEWISPQQHQAFRSFSILTCKANGIMSEIHNTQLRMPVILSMDQVKDWLQPDLDDEAIEQLAKPCPEEWLGAKKLA